MEKEGRERGQTEVWRWRRRGRGGKGTEGKVVVHST